MMLNNVSCAPFSGCFFDQGQNTLFCLLMFMGSVMTPGWVPKTHLGLIMVLLVHLIANLHYINDL